MSADSLVGALTLFAACLGGWHLAVRLKAAGRLYVRFAAILLAALAVCTILGLGDAAALFLLPLVGAALGVAAWAGQVPRIPDPAIALVLVLALGLGLGSVLTGRIMLSLLPVIVAALMAGALALAAGSLTVVLGAMALGLAALAFTGAGAGSGTLLLVAAALVGFARGGGVAAPESAASVQQSRMGRARARIGAGRRDTVG